MQACILNKMILELVIARWPVALLFIFLSLYIQLSNQKVMLLEELH